MDMTKTGLSKDFIHGAIVLPTIMIDQLTTIRLICDGPPITSWVELEVSTGLQVYTGLSERSIWSVTILGLKFLTSANSTFRGPLCMDKEHFLYRIV